MRIQILILEFKGLRHQFPRTSICDEFKCNLQVYLLFSDSKTMATLVNYAPINVNPVGGRVQARGGDLMPETIPLSGF